MPLCTAREQDSLPDIGPSASRYVGPAGLL